MYPPPQGAFFILKYMKQGFFKLHFDIKFKEILISRYGSLSKESLNALNSLLKIDGKLVFCYESNSQDLDKLFFDQILKSKLSQDEELFFNSEHGTLRFFVFTRDSSVQGIKSISFSEILFNCKDNPKYPKDGQFVSGHIYNFSKESQFLFDEDLIQFKEVNRKEFPCFDKVSKRFLDMLEELKSRDINNRLRFSENVFDSPKNKKSNLNNVRIEKLKDALQKGEIDAEDQIDLEKQLPDEVKTQVGDEIYKRTLESLNMPDPDVASKIEYLQNSKHTTILVDIVKEKGEVVIKTIIDFF